MRAKHSNRTQPADHFLGDLDEAEIIENKNGEASLYLRGWLHPMNQEILLIQVGWPGTPLIAMDREDRVDVPLSHPELEDQSVVGFHGFIPLTKKLRSQESVLFCAVLSSGTTKVGSMEFSHLLDENNSLQTKLKTKNQPALDLPKDSFRPDADAFIDTQKVFLNNFLNSGQTLTLPNSDQAELSIIVVVHNRAELTFSCLRSLATLNNLACEIIVVDNNSSDQTAALLKATHGAIIISNQENLHFLRGANIGASEARGKYLLFLNNDTLLPPESVLAALETLKSSEKIGAVGGRLLLPNGRLQEAGGIVLRDGSPHTYGFNQDPNHYRFQFQREVDYCSGAFLLTKSKLFKKLKGFDEIFSPAYYEELDYCIRLKSSGYQTVYEPRALVFHVANASSDADTVTQLCAKHLPIFYERHKDFLSQKPTHNNLDLLLARHTSPQVNRVLFIEGAIPYEEKGIGFPRTLGFLRSLVDAGCFVTLYTLQKAGITWQDIYHQLPRTIEVVANEGSTGLIEFLKERTGYYQNVITCRGQTMDIFLNALNAVPQFRDGTKLIFDSVSLAAFSESKRDEVLHNVRYSNEQIDSILSAELKVMEPADLVLAVSEREEKEINRAGYESTAVLSYGIESAPTTATFKNRYGFIWIGPLYHSEHSNVDALSWFISEVWPSITKSLSKGKKEKPSSALLTAIGEKVVGIFDSKQKRDPSIALIGPVTSLNDYYNQSRVFIAPMRFCGGIPLKVLSAAAHGVPVVCTSLLAKQLGWRDGKDLLVADSAKDFSEACLLLHSDENIWARLRKNALQKIEKDYSLKKFQAAVNEIVKLN